MSGIDDASDVSGMRWSDASHILCIRLDYLGDVLMCTPAMRALRDSAPGRRLTLLSSPGGAAVASFIPELDAALAFQAPWMKHGAMQDANAVPAMAETLRAGRFDAAVIFTTYSQSALPAAMLCQMAGIPLRLAHCRENPYQLLSDWVPETEPQQQVRHEVRRQLDLVASIGCRTTDERMSFSVPDADLAWACAALAQCDIGPDTRWVLMHPGATAASRRYPPAQWAQVLRLLAADGMQAVFTGSVGEGALIDGIREAAGARSHSLAGQATLGQLGALIALAPVMVSNNTGPAHIAAALGTPLVDLYALTNPQHTPWQSPSRVLYHDVPCRNCYRSVCPQGHHDCLARVEPARVAEAVHSLLG
ncbi:lipopolysaccharide heptosyltransferase II [Noviherbaspirillum sp. 1P10PC]|uniref:lipopolysaccharide heptosyltransferase II n=1 Tax=Noviherbaspirillum sp. 1P10PC TaxID=3132292 RepID=UPI00399F1E01